MAKVIIYPSLIWRLGRCTSINVLIWKRKKKNMFTSNLGRRNSVSHKVFWRVTAMRGPITWFVTARWCAGYHRCYIYIVRWCGWDADNHLVIREAYWCNKALIDRVCWCRCYAILHCLLLVDQQFVSDYDFLSGVNISSYWSHPLLRSLYNVI